MKSLVRRGAILATGGAVALAGLPAASAVAQDTAAAKQRYVEQVSTERILRHMEAFQRIADRNGGTRASGTPGYLDSVRYVVGQLRSARYKPTVQAFNYPFYEQLGPSSVERTGPTPRAYVEGVDYGTSEYSGSGDVTAQVQAVNNNVLPPTPTPSSAAGCAPGDFAGFVPGRIALIQRGTCTLELKIDNAEAAGAVAVIFFNEGNPNRTGIPAVTASSPTPLPVIGTTFEFGNELAQLLKSGSTVTMRIATNTASEIRKTYNVIADSTLGNPDRDKTIVVGAHLDSVTEGPGINDNGSGSGMILELARQLHRIGIAPENRVRFAFWGAEESGLVGSEYYVSRLTPWRLGQIGLNLNFDMVASPNGTIGVYDPSLPVSGQPPVPAGSQTVTSAFFDAFEALGEPAKSSGFTGRSDYGPFIAQGIPAGGLFTGAEQPKTEEEAAIWGGVAGEWLDPCYHQACDTLEHVLTLNDGLGLELLDANSDAAASVLFDYAQADDLPGAAGQRASARRAAARSASQAMYRGHQLIR